MKRKTKKPIQLKLKLEGHRKKPQIQRLLGSNRKKNFHSFFRIKGKIIAEKRGEFFGTSTKKVEFFRLNEKGNPDSFALAQGLLSPNPIKLKIDAPTKKLVNGKKFGLIRYELLDLQKNKSFLKKGIGTQILKSLEEMARKAGLELIYGTVIDSNIASQNALKKQGYKNLKGSGTYYKILK